MWADKANMSLNIHVLHVYMYAHMLHEYIWVNEFSLLLFSFWDVIVVFYGFYTLP